MSRLTPIDILHAEFTRAAGGFNRREVREFLERVSSEVEELRREAQELETRLKTLESEVLELREAEADMRRAVVAAERIATDMKQSAEKEAELLLAAADREREERLAGADDDLRRARAELAQLRAQRSLFREQFRGLLNAYLRTLDSPQREREPDDDRARGALLDDSVKP